MTPLFGCDPGAGKTTLLDVLSKRTLLLLLLGHLGASFEALPRLRRAVPLRHPQARARGLWAAT